MLSNVTGDGWRLYAASETAIISSLVSNVGTLGGSSPVDVLNSVFRAGPNTKHMLGPGYGKVEGTSFELGAGAGPGAGLFPANPYSTAAAGWPSVLLSHSRVGKGLRVGIGNGGGLRASVILNSRFEDPADSELNVLGVAINGTSTLIISAEPSDAAPRTEYIFGANW